MYIYCASIFFRFVTEVVSECCGGWAGELCDQRESESPEKYYNLNPLISK